LEKEDLGISGDSPFLGHLHCRRCLKCHYQRRLKAAPPFPVSCYGASFKPLRRFWQGGPTVFGQSLDISNNARDTGRSRKEPFNPDGVKFKFPLKLLPLDQNGLFERR